MAQIIKTIKVKEDDHRTFDQVIEGLRKEGFKTFNGLVRHGDMLIVAKS